MEEGAGDDSDIEVLSLGSGASHPPCRDVPSAVGPGVCGAGVGGRTTMGNVGFDASELNMGAKVLMVLPGLGA